MATKEYGCKQEGSRIEGNGEGCRETSLFQTGRFPHAVASAGVISFGPLRLPDRMKSKLVKGLPQKRRTSPAEVDPTGLAAGLLHRRDATVALHFEGAVVALAARPHGHD